MYGNLILSLFKQMGKYLRLNNIPKLLVVQNFLGYVANGVQIYDISPFLKKLKW